MIRILCTIVLFALTAAGGFYRPCVNDTDCTPDLRFCLEGQCATIACEEDRDCGTPGCFTASCDQSGMCNYTRDCPWIRCNEGTRFACLDCVVNSDCELYGTNYTCIHHACNLTTTGCVRASGWWYKNAVTAFPSVSPAVLGEAIVISDAVTVRAYLLRGYGSNGLDTLAAALLVARLNGATGAFTPVDIEMAMFFADDVLTLCPPNDPVVWSAVRTAGRCDGHSLPQIYNTIAALIRFSDGLGDVPLCNDIGGVRT